MTAGGAVDVTRGDELESRHRVHAVVVGLEPGEEVRFGDPDLAAYWRSSLKPFQALPLARDGVVEALGLGERELAVCCASHVGAPAHLEAVERLLSRIGRDAGALECGPHRPFDGDVAREVLRRGGEFTPLHNNCSGKHAGMMALAVHHGWPTQGYRRPDHPVQRRIRSGIAEWLDVDPDRLAWGTDGCGVPTPCLTLRQMARAYARLGRAAAAGDRPGAGAVVDAMTRHPKLVSGAGRPVTRIMEAADGAVLAKEGAEGVYCMAGPEEGWGLALKVADGARRAGTPAALAVLEDVGLPSSGGLDGLGDLRRPSIRNTRDETVGAIVPRMTGRRAPASPGP